MAWFESFINQIYRHLKLNASTNLKTDSIDPFVMELNFIFISNQKTLVFLMFYFKQIKFCYSLLLN